MPPIVTTVLGTELGTTLLFGFKQQHHCRDGLLPLLVTLPLIMAESRPSSSSVLARPRGWHALPWEGEHLTQDAPTPRPVANLHSYGWQGHCRGLYHTPRAA